MVGSISKPMVASVLYLFNTFVHGASALKSGEEAPLRGRFKEVIKMEIKNGKAWIDRTRKEDTKTPSFIGNNNWNGDEQKDVMFAWRMVAYLKKEGIERLCWKQSIDTRNFTDEDYKRIAATFFTVFMESKRLNEVTDYLLETVIKFYISDRESPPPRRRCTNVDTYYVGDTTKELSPVMP